MGQTGYSQPIPKTGIGGSPRFAARTPIGIFERVPGLRHLPQNQAGARLVTSGSEFNSSPDGDSPGRILAVDYLGTHVGAERRAGDSLC